MKRAWLNYTTTARESFFSFRWNVDHLLYIYNKDVFSANDTKLSQTASFLQLISAYKSGFLCMYVFICLRLKFYYKLKMNIKSTCIIANLVLKRYIFFVTLFIVDCISTLCHSIHTYVYTMVLSSTEANWRTCTSVALNCIWQECTT